MEKECLNEFGYCIRLVAKTFKYRVNEDISRVNPDFTGIQGHIIGYLYGNMVENPERDIFQKNIEAHFSIQRSTATKILQSMEKKDLIYRVPVEKDARLKKIVLTKKAKEAKDVISSVIHNVESEAMKGISKEEMLQCEETLKKVFENLDAEPTEFSHFHKREEE